MYIVIVIRGYTIIIILIIQYIAQCPSENKRVNEWMNDQGK